MFTAAPDRQPPEADAVTLQGAYPRPCQDPCTLARDCVVLDQKFVAPKTNDELGC